MGWVLTLIVLVGGLVALIGFALPVAVAFFAINILGAYAYLGGEAGWLQIPRSALSATANFALMPIPLFVLMGEVMFQTGLAGRAVSAIDKLILKVPGRLGIVSIVGGTLFASLSGSTIANTAMLGSTLLPEMRRRGYSSQFAIGPIMSVGGLAMLIPPSSLAVVLGSLAGISISKLLIAGILPGLLMSALFLGYVVLRCSFNPTLAPVYDVEKLPFYERVKDFVVHVLPLTAIFFCVVGTILLGWATPTESAALGSIASLVAALAYRVLNLRNLRKSLIETAKVTSMIMLIIAASISFSQILSISGAADGLLNWIAHLGLSRISIIIAMIVVLLFLGSFMEQVSIMLITIPFFIPIAQLYQIDMIWFGVMMLIAIEIGLTSPPFGLLVFVMKGVAPDISMSEIYLAAVPYIILSIAVIALVLMFPALATWLVS